MKKQGKQLERFHSRLDAEKASMQGSGRFVYENRTKADLILPKPANDGRKIIPPRGTPGAKFEGDNYFMRMVSPPNAMLIFVEELKAASVAKEEKPFLKEEKNTMKEELILDQPVAVTSKNETLKTDEQQNENGEMLLTEQPIEGLEIITE